MKRFKNILYIITDSSVEQNHTADKVATIARINGAKVTTTIVNENSLVDNLALSFNSRHEEILQAISDQQREKLDIFLNHSRWSGIAVESYNSMENGFISIIQKVIKNKHDLVIKEEDSIEGIEQLAMRLVRKCPSPVWIIKKKTSEFTRILGAIDVSSDGRDAETLNRKVSELTHSLAQRENGEAHYLHVWRFEYETMLRGPRFKMDHDEISKIKSEIFKERLSQLHILLEKCHIHANTDHIHMIEGDVVGKINDMIEELNIDVLVMGSVARSGIPGFLIGNKAETLLNKINCTVLTVKPDGFISPVTID